MKNVIVAIALALSLIGGGMAVYALHSLPAFAGGQDSGG